MQFWLHIDVRNRRASGIHTAVSRTKYCSALWSSTPHTTPALADYMMLSSNECVVLGFHGVSNGVYRSGTAHTLCSDGPPKKHPKLKNDHSCTSQQRSKERARAFEPLCWWCPMEDTEAAQEIEALKAIWPELQDRPHVWNSPAVAIPVCRLGMF